VIFAVLFGRRTILWAAGFGTVIGLGFLASPAVKAMGVGFMAVQMPSMIVTVIIAHLAYGLVLGSLLRLWLPDDGCLLSPIIRQEAIG
jgi:hypothetical protein